MTLQSGRQRSMRNMKAILHGACSARVAKGSLVLYVRKCVHCHDGKAHKEQTLVLILAIKCECLDLHGILWLHRMRLVPACFCPCLHR